MALKEFLQTHGYSQRDLPPIAGTYRGRNLIVCGDAICLWRDLEMFGARCTKGRGRVFKAGWDIMTINKVVEVMPAEVEHCYSNSDDCLKRFVAARRDEYALEFGPPKHLHSMDTLPLQGHGTSSLGGTIAGLMLGYDEIVLCGIPLDDGPHNGEPPWRKTRFESSEAAGDVDTGEDGHWQRARLVAFEGKVKSMSGRTRKWLGAPNE